MSALPREKPIYVKCNRCGTKKRLKSKAELGTKVKCICGNLYVALLRKKGYALPQLSDGFFNKPIPMRRQRLASQTNIQINEARSTPSAGRGRWRRAASETVARSNFPSVSEVSSRLMLSKNPKVQQEQSWHTKKVYEGPVAVQSFFNMYKSASVGLRNRASKTIRRARGEEDDERHERLSPRSAYIEKLDKLKLPPELLYIVRKKSDDQKRKPLVNPLDGSIMDSSVLSSRINMGKFSLGDVRMQAVFASLKLMEFKSVDISGNRLTDVGARAVFQCFSTQCCEFDMSYNEISAEAIRSFNKHVILSHTMVVCELNLEANNLRDKGTILLAEGLGYPAILHSLKRLNVNKNKMTDVGAVPLVKALVKHETLVELSISWNLVRVALALIISDLTNLQHLDAAWTALAVTSGVTTNFADVVSAEACSNPFTWFCTHLGKNKKLLHLDIRFNKLTPKQVNEMGTHLASNNVLLGLHVTGPDGTHLDGHGFLYCLKDRPKLAPIKPAVTTPEKNGGGDEESEQPDLASISAAETRARRRKSIYQILKRHNNESVSNTISDAGDTLRLGDDAESHAVWLDKPHTRARVGKQQGCWICQQWSEVKIICDVEMSTDLDIYAAAKKKGVNLHLSIDGFRGEAMTRKKDTQWRKDHKVKRFCSYRMMPPGTVFFFFSVPIEVQTTVSAAGAEEDRDNKPVETLRKFVEGKRYKSREWSVWLKNSLTFFAPPVPDSISGRQAKSYSNLEVVNYVKVRKRMHPLRCRRALPRVISDGQMGETSQTWNIELSIFKDRLRTSDARNFYNTDRVYKRMLKNDFTFSKCEKFLEQFFSKLETKDKAVRLAQTQILARLERCYRYCVDCFKVGCSLYCDLRDDPKTFKKNGFTTLVQNAGLMKSTRVLLGEGRGHIQTKSMTIAELDMIFLVTNLEEDSGDKKQELMNDLNPDNAINRYEWLEALCRIAVHRYNIQRPKGVNPLRDKELMENQLTIGAAVELCIMEATSNLKLSHVYNQSDDFRRQYLYNEHMDTVFGFMEDRLRRFYNYAAGRSSTDSVGKLGYDPGFLDIFTRMSNDLVHTSTTKGSLEALKIRYAFIYSQMCTVTLLETPGNTATMEFVDFLEGLARIALEVYPPHVIERPLAVGVGRLLAYHFVDLCTEHGKEGKLAQRAEQYLAQYDVPMDQDKGNADDKSESDSETETKGIDESDHGIVTAAMKSAINILGDKILANNKGSDDDDDDELLSNAY